MDTKLKHAVGKLDSDHFTELRNKYVKPGHLREYALYLDNLREGVQSDKKIMLNLGINTDRFKNVKHRISVQAQEMLLKQYGFSCSEYKQLITANVGSEITWLKGAAHPEWLLQRLSSGISPYEFPHQAMQINHQLRVAYRCSEPDLYKKYTKRYEEARQFLIRIDEAETAIAGFMFMNGRYYLSKSFDDLKGSVEYGKEVNKLFVGCPSYFGKIFKTIMHLGSRLYGDDTSGRYEDEISKIKVNELIMPTPVSPRQEHFMKMLQCMNIENACRNKINSNSGVQLGNQLEILMPYVKKNQFAFAASHCLLTLMEGVCTNKNASQLNYRYACKFNLFDHRPAPAITGNYVCYMLYLSLTMYYVQDYAAALCLIHEMLKHFRPNKYFHAFVEIHCYEIVLNMLMNQKENAWKIGEKVKSKIRRGKRVEEYAHALHLIKLMKEIIIHGNSRSASRLAAKLEGFNNENKNAGNYRIMPWLRTDMSFLIVLRSV